MFYIFVDSTLLIVDDAKKYASTEVVSPLTEISSVESTMWDSTAVAPVDENSRRKRRRKREAIGGPPDDGCSYVFADGSRDARDLKELSIQQKFFELQDKGVKEFVLKLNITKAVFDGRKYSYSSGNAFLNIFINDPPENGTCTIQIGQTGADGNILYVPAETGRALLDEFLIKCVDWVDPNDHAITKYIFKLVTTSARGEETTMLYTGMVLNDYRR